MMSTLPLLTAIILIIAGIRGSRIPMLRTQSVISIEGFGACQKSYPNLINLTREKIEPNVYNIAGAIKVNEPLSHPLSLSLTINNCNGNFEPKNCHLSNVFKVDGICDMLMSKNMPWTPFMENSTLPRSCPIKKGQYLLFGSTLNFKQLYFLPNLYGLYKIVSHVNSKNVPTLCVVTMLNIVRT